MTSLPQLIGITLLYFGTIHGHKQHQKIKELIFANNVPERHAYATEKIIDKEIKKRNFLYALIPIGLLILYVSGNPS